MNNRTNEGVTKKNYKNAGRNRQQQNAERAEYLAKKKEILAKQTANLTVINDVVDYLNSVIATNDSDVKINMQTVLKYLSEQKGHDAEATKPVSQINYLLLDLANAQRNKYITGNRITVRVIYIRERFATMFKKELFDDINKMIDENDALFYCEYPLLDDDEGTVEEAATESVEE